MREADKYYSTLHEYSKCPVHECVWISDAAGLVWLSPSEYFELGEPKQKVQFIVYENAVLARKPHPDLAGFSLAQILANKNSCAGLSRIEVHIYPVKHISLHSDSVSTSGAPPKLGFLGLASSPKGDRLHHRLCKALDLWIGSRSGWALAQWWVFRIRGYSKSRLKLPFLGSSTKYSKIEKNKQQGNFLKEPKNDETILW